MSDLEKMAKMDRDVHESTKAMFEQCLSKMIGYYRNGNLEEGNKIRETILDCYFNSMDGNVRMLSEIRQLKEQLNAKT